MNKSLKIDFHFQKYFLFKKVKGFNDITGHDLLDIFKLYRVLLATKIYKS